MEFGLLGPLVVRHDCTELPISAGKQRALLATLLWNAGRTVPTDELIEKLWDDAAPASARNTLQGYVKRLRKALGAEARHRLTMPTSGYALHIEPDELDVARFTAARDAGLRAARATRWAEAATLFADALALWRGPALMDVPSRALAQEALPRLNEMRSQVLDARIKADLELGRHEELIAELRGLVDAYPLREQFHAHLMLAVYRSGRQMEALEVYRNLRALTVEELGVEPTPELQSLHQRILAADPQLASASHFLTDVLTDDMTTPVIAPGPPADAWPARPSPVPGRYARRVVPRQLPCGTSHFVGRNDELDALDRLLDERESDATVAVSAISGMAGIGKTALALRWAHQVADRFPDGQLYIDLRGYCPGGQPVPPSDSVCDFLDALGVPPHHIPAGLHAQAGLYRSLLAGKRVLVVLDNARDSAHVRPLLPGTPGCLALVTSRDRLTGLVATEGAQPLALDVLSAEEAGELLDLVLGVSRTRREPDPACALVGLCARLPMALATVAAHAAVRPHRSLAALVTELRTSPDLLSMPGGEDPVTGRIPRLRRVHP